MAKTVADLVAAAKASIQNLKPEEAYGEHQEGSALFVDIREPEELASSGIIPGSHHAPRGMLEFYADPASPYHREVFDPTRRVVLYCASGGRSSLAADTLQRMGYEHVSHLDGGLKAWKEQGLPVEHETRPKESR